MNKTLAVILGVVLLVAIAFGGMYNRLVSLDVGVTTAWAQVENVLQRRADLIPNLVSTVKGFARHEKDILTKLAEARTQYAGARTPDEKMKAANAMEGPLARLMVIVENYPKLKANETFGTPMYEDSGTHHRIAVERMRYNDAVQAFNTTIQRIPYNIVAGFKGYKPKTFFEAAPEAKAVPKVSFD